MMAEWPDFDPEAQLRSLVRRGADFVVIGAFAAVLHGSSRLTTDLDIAFDPDPANLEILGKALLDLKARLRGVEDEVAFVPDAETLRRVELLTLETSAGPLDLIGKPPGAPAYRTLRGRAERFDLGELAVLVASVDDLIAMKRASGRPKDLADLDELEEIHRWRERG